MTASAEKIPLKLAVLTVSDTRTLDTDTSGQYLVDNLLAAGHTLAARAIVKDDIYQLRAQVSQWIAVPEVQAVLVALTFALAKGKVAPQAAVCWTQPQWRSRGLAQPPECPRAAHKKAAVAVNS